mmetsp:Transcript_66977/g.146054  ORF Transcript_66977/g.146054 Transcript_66977/m.146054 type:complete len:217 (-) Transcript_66977:1843-2493(-)
MLSMRSPPQFRGKPHAVNGEGKHRWAVTLQDTTADAEFGLFFRACNASLFLSLFCSKETSLPIIQACGGVRSNEASDSVLGTCPSCQHISLLASAQKSSLLQDFSDSLSSEEFPPPGFQCWPQLRRFPSSRFSGFSSFSDICGFSFSIMLCGWSWRHGREPAVLRGEGTPSTEPGIESAWSEDLPTGVSLQRSSRVSVKSAFPESRESSSEDLEAA